MIHTLSAASAAGSEIFAAIALLIISLVVLLILRHYLPLRTTPSYLLVPVFFALWLPAFIVLLVPIDLASSAATDDDAARGIWFPERLLLVSWRITYWLTFVLTWFILPILAEYSDAGYREPKDRILYSLRQNAQYQAILLGSGIIGLLYFFISYGIHYESFKGLVMALAYCWGLVLAIYLMGHGLVAIPREIFRKASIPGRLKRLQAHAPGLHEKMEDALLTLEDLEMQVSELSRRKTGSARDFQDWIEELADMCNMPESRPTAAVPRSDVDSRVLPTVITEKYLADLTRRLIQSRHARSRYVEEWHRLLQDAAKAQAVLDSAASKKLDFGRPSPDASTLGSITLLTPYTRYLLHFHVLPSFRIFLGGFFALASACIIWSEMVKVALPKLSVIRLSVVHHWTGDKGQVGLAGQVIAALWILYMCAAALTSVTEVKVWRGRALVRRNTGHESAFWYASQVARLSVPLSYNFMTFLSPSIYTKTIFYRFLGKLIDLTPLGKWFDNLFPILVLIPVCATLFGLYGKVRRMLGFDLELVDDEEENETGYGTGSWREGRVLIERELNGTSISRRRADPIFRASGARATPILPVPASRSESGARTPFATSPGYHDNPTRGGEQSLRPGPAADPEDDNFFTSFGHRFKNTIDGIDTPKWIQEIGDGFKKPKWMGGNEESQASGSGAAGSNIDIRRWFGGDGSIRL
ncbi:LMBR1-like membrane protein-domain-containing protein [Pseudomassariella vexata]|uniref:LMBR1-like membrane protein-domain-containing protein n=1 Tax=Pseudomassariella vexata TaxID=1141098 RepID=A0A1Y2DIY3_9PEZI|nr:LMBR1-like membrane protein-domain-containing protein [Pseudomassariella vexata]ORY59094.1 LMBR1-like membrane protein-domain-containing protein [Pseudomassariella vexata]